ncbi:MAG: GNAT family N-acetyltransferase [Planctomycetales bacterium]|nr:GNAT family N-acetyltransferase [Planctomycetales bacterium]
MTTLNTDDFEWKVIVRPLTLNDFEQLLAMQGVCFPGMPAWTREQIESQLEIFPEGQIVVEVDGKLAASSSSLILKYDPNFEWHDWKKVADNGSIRNHQKRGDTLYGLEMMVSPEFRGMRLSRRLYEARKELCREKNLARIIIGGRIPGYHKHAEKLTAREYVERVMGKALYDPVLTAQMSNGFALRGLIPNYLPSDTDSCGYATFLEWVNFDYKPGVVRRFQSSVEAVRLCVVQYEMRAVASFDEFGKQCEFFLDTASDYKCDFVLFPELFTTQLLSCAKPERPGLAARSLAKFTPQYLEFFSEAAIRYNVNVVAGSQFVVEDDVLYNIAFLFHRDGSISKQPKIHITPSEKKWWGVQPGKRLDVFDTDCGTVGVQICYDIEFPELSRLAAHRGALLTFVPFNTDTRHGYLRVRTCAQARCIENHMYVAISGCTGNLPFVENADIHYAQSGIFTPSSQEFARDAVAAECSPNVETVVIHDLDVEQLRRHSEFGSVQNWKDRRRDMYEVVVKNGDEIVRI